jgi:hypothetical protein
MSLKTSCMGEKMGFVKYSGKRFDCCVAQDGDAGEK